MATTKTPAKSIPVALMFRFLAGRFPEQQISFHPADLCVEIDCRGVSRVLTHTPFTTQKFENTSSARIKSTTRGEVLAVYSSRRPFVFLCNTSNEPCTPENPAFCELFESFHIDVRYDNGGVEKFVKQHMRGANNNPAAPSAAFSLNYCGVKKRSEMEIKFITIGCCEYNDCELQEDDNDDKPCEVTGVQVLVEYDAPVLAQNWYKNYDVTTPNAFSLLDHTNATGRRVVVRDATAVASDTAVL